MHPLNELLCNLLEVLVVLSVLLEPRGEEQPHVRVELIDASVRHTLQPLADHFDRNHLLL